MNMLCVCVCESCSRHSYQHLLQQICEREENFLYSTRCMYKKTYKAVTISSKPISQNTCKMYINLEDQILCNHYPILLSHNIPTLYIIIQYTISSDVFSGSYQVGYEYRQGSKFDWDPLECDWSASSGTRGKSGLG